jgi:hypothetical protein
LRSSQEQYPPEQHPQALEKHPVQAKTQREGMQPYCNPFSHLTNHHPQGETMDMLIALLAIVIVGYLIWFAVSAVRYFKSGDYETDIRIRNISR